MKVKTKLRFSDTTMEHLLLEYPLLKPESLNKILTFEGVSLEVEREQVKLRPNSISTVSYTTGVFLVIPEEMVRGWGHAIKKRTLLISDEQGLVVYRV